METFFTKDVGGNKMRWSILVSCFAMMFAFNVEAADYVLLHGMGGSGGGGDKSVEYWGGHKSGGHCTRRSWGRCTRHAPTSYHPASYLGGSVHAPNYDTTNNGLTSSWLQQTYVNEARKGRTVVAHSMGNPTLAAACYNGKGCVSWKNSQGPLLGSDAADKADTLCNSWWWNWNVGLVVRMFGYCSNAVSSLRTDNSLFQASGYRNVKPSKSFCGYDYSGFRSGNAAKMALVSTLISGEDDGLVPYYSCAHGGNVSRVYCDHEQGTGRAGSGECGIGNWMKY